MSLVAKLYGFDTGEVLARILRDNLDRAQGFGGK